MIFVPPNHSFSIFALISLPSHIRGPMAVTWTTKAFLLEEVERGKMQIWRLNWISQGLMTSKMRLKYNSTDDVYRRDQPYSPKNRYNYFIHLTNTFSNILCQTLLRWGNMKITRKKRRQRKRNLTRSWAHWFKPKRSGFWSHLWKKKMDLMVSPLKVLASMF